MQKELINIKADKIQPYERNPRHNDNAVEAVKESIRQCEYIAPIIIDEDNVILAGHTRYKALKELNKDTIDVVRVTGLSDEQKKKYRILDNKTNELAEWDLDLLEAELQDLDFGDFDFGFYAEEEQESDIDSGDYTTKTDIPQYEIKGEEPEISDLYNSDKADALKEKIYAANIPDEIKDFLMLSANRHVVFNYGKIAEYYANADEVVQDLMEESALVIIDFDNAIRNGYTKLSKTIQEMYEEDEN